MEHCLCPECKHITEVRHIMPYKRKSEDKTEEHNKRKKIDWMCRDCWVFKNDKEEFLVPETLTYGLQRYIWKKM